MEKVLQEAGKVVEGMTAKIVNEAAEIGVEGIPDDLGCSFGDGCTIVSGFMASKI